MAFIPTLVQKAVPKSVRMGYAKQQMEGAKVDAKMVSMGHFVRWNVVQNVKTGPVTKMLAYVPRDVSMDSVLSITRM